MGKFETNQIDVRGDGKVVLYQRPDIKGNAKWQCRVSVDGATGYQRFSTKTSNEEQARTIAMDRYFELKNKVDKGGTLQGKTINQVFEEWKKHILATFTHRKAENVENNTIRLVQDTMVSYLGKKRIDDLKQSDIQDMFVWRFSSENYEKSFRVKGQKYSRKSQSSNSPTRYSVSTYRNYRGAINLFLKYCKQREYTEKEFTFDIPKGKSQPRPHFTLEEWQKLTKYMREWVDEELGNQHQTKFKSPRIYRDRLYLQQYILILGNTGMRVGEARTLKWNNLGSVIATDGDERLVLSVDGKTGRREVVANQGCDRYFKNLYEHRTKELGHEPPKNEYVFCHNDGKSVVSYKKGWINLLEKCKLRTSEDGDYRTIYSLRHTYATQRIKRIPVYQLALNMGTSVKMIEEYYSHAKVIDPQMSQSITQGNQKGSSSVLPF